VSIDETRRRFTSSDWVRVGVLSATAAVVFTALLALAGASDVSITLQSALVHAVSMTVLVSLTMPRLRGAFEWCRPAGARWALRIATFLVLSVAGTALACGVITVMALRPGEPFATCYRHDFSVNAVITLTLGISMTLYEAQRRRLDAVTTALQERELAHERDRKTALEARLASLEARLQPHFMFNTLNAISALIQEDPDEAERTVERLAALLRFSLDATERGLVPLAHELKIVTDYLEIERTRFGERLAYTVDVAPDVTGVEVPPLAVQTLVENSVKHAIAPRPLGGRVRIAAAAVGDQLTLSVWDDGPGFTADAMRAGHGLDNLRDRLAARFGAHAGIDVGRQDDGTLVTVTLPRSIVR